MKSAQALRSSFIEGLLVLAACLALSSFLFGAPPTGGATREEVLSHIYPGASFRPERVFLTEGEMQGAAKESGEEIPTALIARYIVERAGVIVGRAYIDTHVVRTKKESLLICLNAEGQVMRVEVTAFLEPPEYRASEPWYGQFADKALSEDLRLQRDIRPIAGATLTAMAATRAVRRVLAIDGVLAVRGK